MGCQTEVYIDDYFTFSVMTHDPELGGDLSDADGAPTYRIYEDETAAAILTGTMAKLDDANTLGFYTERLACTAANGFEDGKTYTIYIEATVNAHTGGIAYSFRAQTPIWSETTRTLTSTAAATAAAVSGSDLTITIAATYAATLSGMTIAATWTKCYFTVKASASEADAASVLQLVVTNPAAAATDGVLYVEGVAATAAQRTMGSLTVNQVAGTVAIALSDDLTAALHAHGNLVYDIKTVLAAGSSTVHTAANVTVSYTPTRTV